MINYNKEYKHTLQQLRGLKFYTQFVELYNYQILKGINLGCADKILPGFDNIDYKSEDDRVIIQNLFVKDWKNIRKNYYGYIYSSHFFEHIPYKIEGIYKDFFYHFMDNLFKIAKDKALIEIKVSYPHIKQLCHKQHIRLISLKTFEQYLKPLIHSRNFQTNKSLGSLRLLEYHTYRTLPFKRINDFHFRKYLFGLEVGKKDTLVMVFEFQKGR